MERKFMKGCEAIAEAAVRAGCRFFAGYPITPQNEIPEYMSRIMPKAGGVFVQGESEVAASYMIYGAASSGTLAMTSSSSVGVSLKAEGMSYMAAARLPMVLCSVMRAGPGVGVIQPSQTDYLQAAKCLGSGGFRTITYAPSTLQEAVDLTYKAFGVAWRDRNPVVVCVDGFIAAIMEAVDLPEYKELPEVPDWATTGMGKRGKHTFIMGGALGEPMQLEINKAAQALYDTWGKDVEVEEYKVDGAEYVIAAYGTSARICRTVVDELREEGLAVGMIRPITISPYPYDAFGKLDPAKVKAIIDVEMSIPAQMVDDVTLGVKSNIPVETVLTAGGFITSGEAVKAKIRELAKEGK